MSTLFEALAQWAGAQPEALALITETDGTRTYAELVHNAAAIGAALHGDLGVAPGDTVTLLAANRPAVGRDLSRCRRRRAALRVRQSRVDGLGGLVHSRALRVERGHLRRRAGRPGRGLEGRLVPVCAT